MKKYRLTQKYYGLPTFTAEGTLEELVRIITVGGGEIVQRGENWFYRLRDTDEHHIPASSLIDAVSWFGSHDTSAFNLTEIDA